MAYTATITRYRVGKGASTFQLTVTDGTDQYARLVTRALKAAQSAVRANGGQATVVTRRSYRDGSTAVVETFYITPGTRQVPRDENGYTVRVREHRAETLGTVCS